MSAKTSRPDRKRGGRRDREPSEFAEATLSVDRVTRVVKGGRRMRFRAIVVMGNRKGKVGLGTGKASEVQAAVKKATSAARRAMIKIPIVKGTIPHEVDLKFKAARIRIIPAVDGTGIIAGGALRVTGREAPEEAPKAATSGETPPSADAPKITVVKKGDVSREGTLKA